MAVLNFTITSDAGAYSSAGTSNFGTNAALTAGVSGSFTYDVYMHVDLSSLPAGSTISSAPLRLVLNGAGAGTTALTAQRVTGAWTETGLTYNTRPGAVAVAGQGDVSIPVGAAGQVYTVDIAPVLNEILATGVNNGIKLVGTGGYASLASAEHATTSYRPSVAITYDTAPVVTHINFAAPVATASALSPNAVVDITATPNNSGTWPVTADTYDRLSGAVINQAGRLELGSDYVPYFKVDLTGLDASGVQVVTALFEFDASTAGVVYEVRSIDQTWTEAGATGEALTMGAVVLPGGTTSATYGTTGMNSVDITTLVKQWVAGTRTNNGFALVRTGGGTHTNIASRENTTEEIPRLAVAYYAPGISNEVAAPALTASAQAVDASVAVSTNVSIAAAPADLTVAALLSPTVVVSTSPDVTVFAGTMSAGAEMTEGGFSSRTDVFADPAEASAALTEASVAVQGNATIKPTPVFALATLIPSLEGQGEEYDPYFTRLVSQMGNVDGTGVTSQWFRFDETSGAVAVNRLGNDATYHGVTLGQTFGPEGRRSVSFDGVNDWIEVYDTDHLANYSRLEVTFKTTKANQTIATGTDTITSTPNGAFAGPARKTGLEMSNGRIRVFGGGNSFTGRTVLNDGQWHHVVWLMDNGTTRVYVDGKLEFRRLLVEGGTINSIIDGIGGGPDRISGTQMTYDPAMFFAGEMMEFVYQKDGTITEDEAINNYYAVFGITPVRATVMSATAVSGEAKGKGNRKRALGLWYYDDAGDAAPANGHDVYRWSGINNRSNFPDYPVQTNVYGQPVPFNMGEFLVFPKSITRNETSPFSEYLGGSYYDEVTGEPRYIDVSTDVDDVESYDLIFFINMPPRYNKGAGFGEEPQHLNRLFENMVEGVRKVVDRGVSLWVPQPELAIELGVVDRVEAHSMRRESFISNDQGNALGLYDRRGAEVNPWDNNPEYNARYYHDSHALNRYRVTAVVEGLTTLGGYIDQDFFFGRPRDPFKPSFFGWKFKELPNGLQIGDEFMYGSQDEYDVSRTSSSIGALLDRFSVVSVPAGNVKAGTVVTTENATHWVGNVEVANPFASNATTIVLEPGDSLKGRPVGGKVFVNFMEGAEALGWTTYERQVVPPNSEIGQVDRRENEEQRAWGYTTFRTVNTSFTAEAAPLEDGINDPARERTQLTGINTSELYPVESLRRYGMAERGLTWLADREEIGEGDKVIRPAPLTAVATVPKPATQGQRSTTVAVAPAVALATLRKPANVSDPDVAITTLPLVATARMTGYGRTFAAGPMVATAELVENFDLVMAGGEQVVVFLHHTDATLYLLEDA